MISEMDEATVVDLDSRRIEAFVFREARLQDEHRYEEWESLWTDDGVYWVPCNGDDIDPEHQVSIIYDNRTRIASRIRQLMSGRRHAQSPTSQMRRVIGNFEMRRDEDDVEVACNFILCESRRGDQRLWSGRTVYRLREVDGQLRMARKNVFLVGNDSPIETLAFLI